MNSIFLFFVTCGFIGYLPFMPGTWASLFACFVLYFLPVRSLSAYVILILFVACATVCINMLTFEGKDPPYIVIDELCGMFITMAGHGTSVINLLIGFMIFRFFDIVKPYPVKYVERYKKGCGIMADDIIAGVFANICTSLFIYIRGLFR